MPNEELFALIYTIDAKDDWTSEKALRKANPNYDVSVKGEFLLARQREAINNARKAGTFKTKHLNMWVQARAAYFDIPKWIASAVPELKLEDFKNQPCRLGLDLASKVDIAAIEIVFDLAQCQCATAARLIKAGFKYARFGKYFLPEDTINRGENEHYRTWQVNDLISQTDGEMIDYVEIRETILDIRDNYQIEEVAYDPHNAMMMISELMQEGIPVSEVRPLVLNFSEPMKQMDALIRAKKIAHDGDEVFTWMLSNVVAKPDGKDNVYPRKEREENKIDGPVAHIMTQARFLSGQAQSVYETRGLLEIEIQEV
jgi:phage terminase large subunit-like protein